MLIKKSKSPKVSVLLPTFNGEEFISKAIESVLSQTFTNFELIIINDASRDNVQKIIDSYSAIDSRIINFKNSENLGLVKSLNKGIKIAEGEYLARIDDDDTWNNRQKLEKQIDFLDKNPEYGLIGTKAKIINSLNTNLGELGILKDDIEIRKNILNHNPFCHSSVIFRKKILNSSIFYNDKLKYTEDWDLWLRIGKLSKFANLDFLGVNYLKRDGMSSKNTKIKQVYYHLRILLRYSLYYPRTIIAFLKLINYTFFY